MSKSLIENILLKLEAENPKDHSGFQHGIEAAIGIIKQAEKDAEFEDVARVIIKHLNNPDKYHPHHTAIITPVGMELVEGVSGRTIHDYLND
jgi:hypothetical protein